MRCYPFSSRTHAHDLVVSPVPKTPVGKIPMTNVIGVLRGERPTAGILASHYDTAQPAANGQSFAQKPCPSHRRRGLIP